MKTDEHFTHEATPCAPVRRFWSVMTTSAWRTTAMAGRALQDDPRPPIAAAESVTAACRCSPREMAELSLDLFLAGVLTDEEYALLAFQPELHPDFDRTIGALTGQRANPDQPRDYVAAWRDRLEFEHSRRRPDHDLIDRIQRILFVLRRVGTVGRFGSVAR